MLAAFALWLDQAGSTVFWTCIVGALAIDTIAVATVVSTRSRELVNKWTGPVLVTNALLLGGGTVLPVAMHMTSVAVMAVALDAPMGTALTR